MVKDIALGAEGLGFDYRVGQIGRIAITVISLSDRPKNRTPDLPCDVSLKLCCPDAKPPKWALLLVVPRV